MTPYPLVFPAVLLATLASGVGGGLVALVVGMTTADYFFVQPRFTFGPRSLNHGFSMAVTAFALLCVLWLAARYRTIMISRAHERDEMMKEQLEIFENSHGFKFVLTGPEYRFEYANPTYLRLIEKSKEDLLGRTLRESRPRTPPLVFEQLDNVRETKEAYIGKNIPRRSYEGGVERTRYFNTVYQPILDKVGSVDAIYVEGFEVTDGVEAEQHLRFLLREVDHRANNLLAIVQSIINLTKADGAEARNLKRDVLGRIGALARAHQLLASTRWRGANLESLVEEELRPYALGDHARADGHGPGMPLSPAEAEGIAMALHELATNAAKYGAFSAQAGRVEVTWRRDSSGARHIRWQEVGGPLVVEPDRHGLGIRLLKQALAASGGRTKLCWRPEGLVCEFRLPPEGSGSIAEPMGMVPDGGFARSRRDDE
jgi:two-component sensor histidine kinase